MQTLVRKMSNLGLLKMQLVLRAVLMAVAALALPIGLVVMDVTLLANPYIWGAIVGAMLLFGLVCYFGSIRPYTLYHKTPTVLAETDGEFLYIHTKEEAKIPVADLEDSFVHVSLPYLYQKEFVADFLVHMFSERYGDIYLEVPGYGEYRMRFVSNVSETANELIGFIRTAINSKVQSENIW